MLNVDISSSSLPQSHNDDTQSFGLLEEDWKKTLLYLPCPKQGRGGGVIPNKWPTHFTLQ